MNEYKFLKMYKNVCTKRILGVLLYPLISIIAVGGVLYFMVGGKLSTDDVFRILHLEYFIVLEVLMLGLALKIHISKEHNLNLLYTIYQNASSDEIADIGSIKERGGGYIFTKDYLINWDGALNIVPLGEIEKIKYVGYFYLVLYGTKLKIKCKRRTYTITYYGPSSREWINRGFMDDDGRGDKEVIANVEIPMG